MNVAGASLLALVVVSGACGGSSSETPWPVEPENTAPAPQPDVRGDEPRERAEPDAGTRPDVEP